MEDQKLRILWVNNPDYTAGERQGANLRYINFAKNLRAAGHTVTFAVNFYAEDAPAAKRAFLHQLRTDGVIDDFVEIEYSYSRFKSKLAEAALHPHLVNRWILKPEQHRVDVLLRQYLSSYPIDVAIVSDRRIMFVAPLLRRHVPVVLDWVDSLVLFWHREMKARLAARQFGALKNGLRDYKTNYFLETYYGRHHGDVNLTVSPVDNEWLNRLTGTAAKNHVLFNGVRVGRTHTVGKDPKRIIFSGTMDFPPNYQAALFFINEVLPLIEPRVPGIRYVVAGSNPIPELQAKAGGAVEVTGFVEDLEAEIARSSLYVATMRSGGGFKNKVVEALSNGTYVLATSLAVEFLEDDIKRQLLIADEPRAIAEAVIAYLQDPGRFTAKLAAARQLIEQRFPWPARSAQLADLLRKAQQNWAAQD